MNPALPKERKCGVKAFVSWSGGKETVLSFYKAMSDDRTEVAYLLNMVSEDGRLSRSHGVGSALLRKQAEAIGIPIVQKKSSWPTYEKEFKAAVEELKKEGVDAGIFGDIDLQEHRDWVERVCGELGIRAILPLWGRKREDLLKEFIDCGFEALVVAVRDDVLGREWIGRKIDENFIKDIRKLGTVDLCGEKGEYHTFVTDGPIFKKPVKAHLLRRQK